MVRLVDRKDRSKEAAARIQIFALTREEKAYERFSDFVTSSGDVPLEALISEDGKYVVTFDSKHGFGRGDNVVVVYETKTGRKLKNWSLDEILTKEDRRSVVSTVSSDWWREGVNFAYGRPGLLVNGPSLQFDTKVKRYCYELDFTELKWTKKF